MALPQAGWVVGDAMDTAFRRTAFALAALLALSGVLTAAAGAVSTPAVPIPSDPRDRVVQPFTGSAATAQPYAAQQIPRNPFMAPNERSNIHNDAYQTDAYNVAGPLGRDPKVTSTMFAAECASVTFDSKGRIVTVCVSPIGATLRMLDPKTLATLASYELPPREPGTFSFSNFSGGGYFYLDDQDRAVVATFTGHLLVIAEDGANGEGFKLVRDVDVSKATGGSGIQSALPDWAGRIWFVTRLRCRRVRDARQRGPLHAAAAGRDDREQLRDGRVGWGLHRLDARALPVRRTQ